MQTTPIAVFTYNRPQHTRQMLNSLAKCARLDECHVVIYSDGPRTADHVDGVEEARRVIRSWSQQYPALIVERSTNWGLARSIVSGVSDLCGQSGRVIVVEDDLVLHAGFIHYMLSALDRYAGDERVGQVAGYMFPVHHPAIPDAFFLPYISSWGWATWDRAWRLFEAVPDISALSDPDLTFRFNHNGVTNHAEMLRNRMAGRNQSWAVLFYWAVFTHKKLILYPRASLVKNTGFDGTGVHYAKKMPTRQKLKVNYQNWLFNRIFRRLKWDGAVEFVWPDKVVVDDDSYRRISSYRKLYAGGYIQFVLNTLYPTQVK